MTTPPKPTPTDTPTSSETLSGPYIASVERSPARTEESNNSGRDLKKEFVIIENPGPDDQDMTDWTLNNERLDTYQFPDDFILRGETVIRVWTQDGTDTDVELYWGSEKAIWSSEEGVAYLRDHTGTLIDVLDW
ncbi:MAG: lamin tail domain-containing protein [Chloroflexi bacterium]|nr:lamin tail domain-containing protein [Chloroflexota bacterium]